MWFLRKSLCFPAIIQTYCIVASFIPSAIAQASSHEAPPSGVERRSINNAVQLNILPLGASIVWGQDSTDGNGFRLRLQTLLESGGNNVSYVGTVFHGNMSNNACEAYPGHTIDEVGQLALRSGAFGKTFNVVLLHLGTNDCRAMANETATIAADRFGSLLTTIKQQDADAFVVASTLIHALDPLVDSCITNFNSRLPAIIQHAKDAGQKVELVDMHDAVPRNDINTTDGIHPTDAGYEIMADIWYKGLINASTLISPLGAKGKGAPTTPSSVASLRCRDSILTLAAVLLVLGTFLV